MGLELPEWLEKLGFSRTVIAAVLGLIVGATSVLLYMQKEADAHAAQIAALTAQHDSVQIAQGIHCQEANAQLALAQARIRQLSQSISEWKAAYDVLTSTYQRSHQQDQLAGDLGSLRISWFTAAADVESFTSGRCNDGSNDCDLTVLSQRKLHALEAKRDQLHSQLLDMQSGIACSR